MYGAGLIVDCSGLKLEGSRVRNTVPAVPDRPLFVDLLV